MSKLSTIFAAPSLVKNRQFQSLVAEVGNFPLHVQLCALLTGRLHLASLKNCYRSSLKVLRKKIMVDKAAKMYKDPKKVRVRGRRSGILPES